MRRLTSTLNLQRFSTVGFGRRICPGMNIAEKSLHILIARMAWGTSITRRPGCDVLWYDCTTGFNVKPKRFVFDLNPRNEARAGIVEWAWLESRAQGSPFLKLGQE